MPDSLDVVVTAVATKLMAATSTNTVEVLESVLADLVARTIVAPRQLPVGALTALIGVPLAVAAMPFIPHNYHRRAISSPAKA